MPSGERHGGPGFLVLPGAAAFKFSTFGTHPQRFPRIPPPSVKLS